MTDGRDDETAQGLATAAFALARSFAGGATLWCWAPGAPRARAARRRGVRAPGHRRARGRCPPSRSSTRTPPRPCGRSARAGDVLLVVADADAPVAATLRRAPAWGLTTIWMGAGAARPPDGTADHVLWLSDDPMARHDGRLVLGYHLLWELTHVCFEHPGLLASTGRLRGRRVHHVLRRGPLGEVVGDDGRHGGRAHRDRHRDRRARRWSGRCSRATSCSSTPAPRSRRGRPR